jgi:hypothetical protein
VLNIKNMSLAKRALEMKDTNPLKKEILDFLSGKSKIEKVIKPKVVKSKKESTTGFISFG